MSSVSGVSSSNSSSSSTSTASSAEVTKDQFLTLLTYQLKSQNPLDPYDNQQFASTLAQFSQLETLTDIRSLIEEQVETNVILTNTISNSALPGLLGKNAKVQSDSATFDGSNSVDLDYSLTSKASSVAVKVKDSSGNTVNTYSLSGTDLTNGDHTFTWDGTKSNGSTADAGVYTFEITATNSNGDTYTPDTYMTGTIQAVKFKDEGTVLLINGVEVALEDVLDITT